MSQSEVARFATALQGDAALRAEVEKDGGLANAVAVAGRHGYSFTLDDAKAFVAAKAKAVRPDLSDGELDRLTGGSGRIKGCTAPNPLFEPK